MMLSVRCSAAGARPASTIRDAPRGEDAGRLGRVSRTTITVTPELQDYLAAQAPPPDDVVRDLVAETAGLGRLANMQISLDQGAFLALLARLVGARRTIEVGTFTGFSTLSVARALPDDGRILACDVSEEWTSMARRYWERAGVAHKIDLQLAPALETLQALPREAAYDFAFIDADKSGYIAYWEQIVPRTRPGGLVVADNVLWSGRVVDPGADDEDTKAIREFNEHVLADDRVDSLIVPVADGLTLARVRDN
jgi:caffeoyl-CoA O-methyltransferase